jgi:hypothetical protein
MMLDMVLDARNRPRGMLVEGADARRDDKKREEGGRRHIPVVDVDGLVLGWGLPLAITYGLHGVLWAFLAVLQAL